MKKSTKIALVAGAVVMVAAAISYFTIVPMLQVSGYKKAAEAKHAQVNDKMMRVYDSFKRNVFTDPKSEPENDKVDVQVGLDAVKDARATLDANAPAMTKFSALPLLGWQKSYRQATDIDNQETAYVKDARSFLNDYETLLTFTGKETDIGLALEQATKQLQTLGDLGTPAAMAAALDDSIGKLRPFIDQDRALTVPAYLKANHDQQLQSITQMLNSLSDLAAAARALDLTKITKISADIDHESADLDTQSRAEITLLQHDSPIAHQLDRLRTSGNTVTLSYAKL